MNNCKEKETDRIISAATGTYLGSQAGTIGSLATFVKDSFLFSDFEKFAKTTSSTGHEVFLSKGIEAHLLEIKKELQETNKMIKTRSPIIISAQIYNLASEEYRLRVPVDVILEKHEDEVLALLPELTLCGEGKNELEAIADLKSDILDLVEDLENVSEDNLGADTKLWKQSLDLMVERCR